MYWRIMTIKGNIHTTIIRNQLKKEFEAYLETVESPQHPQVLDDLLDLTFKVLNRKQYLEYRELEERVLVILKEADISISKDQQTQLITNLFEEYFEKDYYL